MLAIAAAGILEEAVAAGVFPGGVLLVADAGEVLLEHSFGVRARVGPSAGVPVTRDTVYDVASLTKPAVTAALVLRLVEAGRLALDTPAAAFVPELGRRAVRIRDLLSHSAGLPAWRPYYETLVGLPAADRREAIVRLAAAEAPEVAVGERAIYSDLGFILLGTAVERAGGERLDRLAARALFGPLGMTSSRFVDLAARERPLDVAPTEACPRRGLLTGEVHDDNAHAAGGILGHAGLFSTAVDLSRLTAALVASWHGEIVPGGFPPALVREMWSPSGVPGSTWRLGWDSPSPIPGSSSAGELWPRDGVGHLGFTGCSLWIDPPRRRWVILLTNRVHPSRNDNRIRQVRPAVHDAIASALA
jgi:serine-type D-Ala-D-Ala carboxypeptidase